MELALHGIFEASPKDHARRAASLLPCFRIAGMVGLELLPLAWVEGSGHPGKRQAVKCRVFPCLELGAVELCSDVDDGGLNGMLWSLAEGQECRVWPVRT